MFRNAAFFALILLFTTAASADTPAVKAISAADADNHVVQRVEPIVPWLATQLSIGGTVKLHIVISTSGDVSSAEVKRGNPVLVPSAIETVKKWKYKPFTKHGKPILVKTDVELFFPGGMPEHERKVRNKRTSLELECYRLLNYNKYPEAESKCREAVKLSNELPKQVILERSGPRGLLAQSIFLQGRIAESVPLYEEALALDKGYLKTDDADLATDYENLGRAYAVMGELAKADGLYATAVSTFRAAIQALPMLYAGYSGRLRTTLNEYAQIKAAEGQVDSAAELRKQADEISLYVNPTATVPPLPAPEVLLRDDELSAKIPKCTHGRFAVAGVSPEDFVSHVMFTPDSHWLVATRDLGGLDIWDTSSWQKVRSIDTKQCGVSALAISSDGKLVATGSHGNTVKIWGIEDGKSVAHLGSNSKNTNEFVDFLAFSPKGDLLATGGSFTRGLVFNLRTHHTVATLGGVKGLSFSSDGKLLFGAMMQEVLAWDTSTWKVERTIEDPQKNATALALDERNQRIAVSGAKGIRIMNLNTGELSQSIPDAATNNLHFTSDWNNMVTDGNIGLWSVRDSKVLCESPGGGRDLALSPDAKFLAVAGERAVRIWKMESLEHCMTQPQH